MKIYADFNGIEQCGANGDELCLDLTGFGTLASLSHHSVRLRQGMTLTFSDFDSLSVTALVEFDERRIGSASAGWYARFKKSQLRDEEPTSHDFDSYPCFNCREDLKPYLATVGHQFYERCPKCGTPVLFPLSAPDKR